jgi:putative endopeptidase
MKVVLRIAGQKEGFDYDAFFRAYADNYMSVMTPEFALQMMGDFHPMNYLRINVVLQHFDEFLNLYDIHEGDGMYLAPEDRVAIW